MGAGILLCRAMLHYFKFRDDILPPCPGKPIYIKPGPGKGWPQECPPLRAACAFGFDVLANFDVTFIQKRDHWTVEPDTVIDSDFSYASNSKNPGSPLTQQYAWGWKKGQKLPHVISDHVYTQIRHQMKISSFLFLKTDPDEMLLMTEVPNMVRPWRAMTALIETDWYPASYPWHTVIELDRRVKKVALARGEPLCRLIPLQRGKYSAGPMSHEGFDKFFTRGQKWLLKHGAGEHEGMVDIKGAYKKRQRKSEFVVR
jgi:hypothetical protein